ncbi:hypothetical protein [Acinetobacter sp. XS-4]|uniref:hypothetical protein n=1 Tax=Acinetobacter sp. XS-4 TaxID=2923375 RepID=UPI00208E596B|nr:hypothetical protein [Acinetobacter sp. XS-4]USP42179.1 hypothetical protein MMY79_08985 [Acinetobacter sp. XS-4]
MTKSIPHKPVSLDEIINNHEGRCVIINCNNYGLLCLGTGLDSVGDVIAEVYETNDYDKWMKDRKCIWYISEAKEGYYLKNERDPGKEFYLFRGADLDPQGDYTIYGESEWHNDRKSRTEFDIWKKAVEHSQDAHPVPISYFIKVSDDTSYGREYYLKSGVAKDRWDTHQVYASPTQTNDERDEWFLFPVP